MGNVKIDHEDGQKESNIWDHIKKFQVNNIYTYLIFF